MLVFKFVYCILRTIFVVVSIVYSVPTYCIWMLVFLRPIKHTEKYLLIQKVGYRSLLLVAGYFSYSAGYLVKEVGDDINDLTSKRCLLMLNHQSSADVLLLIAALQLKYGVSENLMWVIDDSFKRTPFGWVCSTHGDYFITQGKANREKTLLDLREHIVNVYLPRALRWVIIFPEGGFLSNLLEGSQKYAQKNGLPSLTTVTLPRIGAAKVTLEALSASQLPAGQDAMEYVIDITIGYPGSPKKPLDFISIVTGYRRPYHTTFHYRRFAVKDIPFEDESKLTTWFFDRWVEKEQMLKHYYENGSFPDILTRKDSKVQDKPGQDKAGQDVRPRLVELHQPYVIFVHLCFICSSMFHIYMFKFCLMSIIF